MSVSITCGVLRLFGLDWTPETCVQIASRPQALSVSQACGHFQNGFGGRRLKKRNVGKLHRLRSSGRTLDRRYRSTMLELSNNQSGSE